MAKDKYGWDVPTDWDGVSTISVMLCMPASVQWMSILNDCVTQMTRQYNYKGNFALSSGAKETGLEVYNSMISCDLGSKFDALIAAINRLSASSCGCEVGSGADAGSGEEGGTPPGPIAGVPYEEAETITDRKCKAANYIYQSVADAVYLLDVNHVDDYAYAGVGFVVTVISAIMVGAILGPFGALLGAVVGVVLAMASLLLFGTVNLDDVWEALDTNADYLVCELYGATTADNARTAFLAVLSAYGLAGDGLALVELLIPNSVLNLLFFEWADSASIIDEQEIIHECACLDNCDLKYRLMGESGTIEAGSGSLVDDTTTRTLTAVNLPSTPYWYVSFQLGPQSTLNGVDDQSNLPTYEECGYQFNKYLNIVSVSASNVYGYALRRQTDGGFNTVLWGTYMTGSQEIGNVDCIDLVKTGGGFSVDVAISPGTTVT